MWMHGCVEFDAVAIGATVVFDLWRVPMETAKSPCGDGLEDESGIPLRNAWDSWKSGIPLRNARDSDAESLGSHYPGNLSNSRRT